MKIDIQVTDDFEYDAGTAIITAIEDVYLETGRCRLGLSGGSTPKPVFVWLADNLPEDLYAGLWVTWVDERMTDDAIQRNDISARRAWFNKTTAPARMLPMTSTGYLQADQERFADAFETEFGGLDVVVLGAGTDGHIASLFPNHPSIDALGSTVAITDSPKPPATRLSLTLPVLERVEHAILLARGAEKSEMLGRALKANPRLPLGRYRPKGKYQWILDSAAAQRVLAMEKRA